MARLLARPPSLPRACVAQRRARRRPAVAATAAAAPRPDAPRLFATPSAARVRRAVDRGREPRVDEHAHRAHGRGRLARPARHRATHRAPGPDVARRRDGRGPQVVFVAGTGGRVAELALAASGAALSVSRCACCARWAARPRVRRSSRPTRTATWSRPAQRRRLGVARAIDRRGVRTIPAVGDPAHRRRQDSRSRAATPSSPTTRAAARRTRRGHPALLTTGRRLRTVTNATDAAYAFSSPAGISSDGTHLWEINAQGTPSTSSRRSTLRSSRARGPTYSTPAGARDELVRVGLELELAGQSSMVTQFQSSITRCRARG